MTREEKKRAFVDYMMRVQDNKVRRAVDMEAQTELDRELDAVAGEMEARQMVERKFGLR